MTSVFITASAIILASLLTLAVRLYLKRLERMDAVQKQHSEEREKAYDRLLAAGDAGWYYRTLRGVDPDLEDTDWQEMEQPIIDLFNIGFDQLAEHAKDLQAVGAALMNWVHFALENNQSGPREFEYARDVLINLKRQEAGLQNNILQVQELPFYDRLLKGHSVQRLPEGVQKIIRMTDGGFIVMGAGGEFDKIFGDIITRSRELRESRKTARRRLEEWRKKGVWKKSQTEREASNLGEDYA